MLRADQAAKAGLIIRDMIQSRRTVMVAVLMRFRREREGGGGKLPGAIRQGNRMVPRCVPGRNDVSCSITSDARQITKRRMKRGDSSFVDLSIHEVPVPLKGSKHRYKYRLAHVVDGVCVMRYDNEAGKGDHKHVGARELPYAFVDLETLLRDFFADVERMER